MRLGLGLGLGVLRGGRGGPPANPPPTDIAWAGTHEIAEDATLGTLIGGALTAVDPGDTGTFSMPLSTRFDVIETGGEWRVRLIGVLDFETAPSYSETIRFTDSDGNVYDEVFAITVTDVSEDVPEDPPPEDPPPVVDDEGNFDVLPYSTVADGSVKFAGKKKANGQSAKMLHDFADELGALAVDTEYVIRWTADFSLMAQQGELTAVGIVLKAGQDFWGIYLRGDGVGGVDIVQVYGDNLWNAFSGFTEVDGGAAAHGDLDGPNWLRLVTSADGTTITISTGDDYAWQDTFTKTLDTNDNSWAGYTLRQPIPATAISVSGDKIKFLLEASSDTSVTISAMYFYERGVGEIFDFLATPTPITFDGGSAGAVIAAGQTKWTDEIIFAVDETKSYVASFAFGGVSSGVRKVNDSGNAYYKAGSDAATVDASGYSIIALTHYFIKEIEVGSEADFDTVEWTEEFAAAAPEPFANISEATQWGLGAIFHADDAGPYSIPVTAFRIQEVAVPLAWNSADKSAGVSLFQNDLTVEHVSGTTEGVRGVVALTGKKVFAIHNDKPDAMDIGLAKSSLDLASTSILGSTAGIGYRLSNGQVGFNSSAIQIYGVVSVGEIGLCAFDADAGDIWFGKVAVDGAVTWNGDPGAGTGAAKSDLDAGPWYPACCGISAAPSFRGTIVPVPVAAVPSGFEAHNPSLDSDIYVASYWRSLTASDSDGWNGSNLRQQIPAANLSRGGSMVRVTLQAGDAQAATFSHVVIMEQSSAEDGTGTIGQITFSGSASGVAGAASRLTSDAASFTLDATKAYLIGMYFNGGTGSDNIKSLADGTFGAYSKAGSDELNTLSVTGYSSIGNVRAVVGVEVRFHDAT